VKEPEEKYGLTTLDLLVSRMSDLKKLLKLHEEHERYEVCEWIKRVIELKKDFDI
jgi:hypothetical protein